MNWWKISARTWTRTTWSKPKTYLTAFPHLDQASGSVRNHCVVSSAINSKTTLKVFKSIWKSVSTIQKRDSTYAIVKPNSAIEQCSIIISTYSSVCVISAPVSWFRHHQARTWNQTVNRYQMALEMVCWRIIWSDRHHQRNIGVGQQQKKKLIKHLTVLVIRCGESRGRRRCRKTAGNDFEGEKIQIILGDRKWHQKKLSCWL